MLPIARKFYVSISGLALLMCCNASPNSDLPTGSNVQKAESFEPRQRPLRELMGINAIWGWGSGRHSRNLDKTQGPYLFNEVATWVRSYHNLSWDTKDPDNTPDFNDPSSLNLKWAKWDEEYAIWKDAGLEIQASLQFRMKQDPPEEWNNPYQAAYDYAYAFTKHFGPTHGNGYISAIEAGNEPWEYEADFYRQVLLGMAKGAKEADPAMIVLPAALQTTHPENEKKKKKKNYLPARIPDEAVPYLDALNFHHYSYKMEGNKRRGSHPENPQSSFQNLKKNMAYVEQHFPGKEVQVTEWGWGSSGGGDNCVAPECVSEQAQAIYAARGLFLMDSYGVDKAFWYYFHSLPGGKQIYGRCGLVSSKRSGWQKKASFYAFETIKEVLGDEYLIDIRKQDKDGYVYVYGDAQGKPRHLVGWLPVDAEDSRTSEFHMPVKSKVRRAFLLNGNPVGLDEVAISTAQKGEMVIPLSTVPVVVELE